MKHQSLIIRALRVKLDIKVELVAKIMRNEAYPENLQPQELPRTFFLLHCFVLDYVPLLWVLVSLEHFTHLRKLPR
jgi:hypothetical protein